MKLAEFVEPVCASGLIPLTGTQPFTEFQQILGDYLNKEPCFWRLDVTKRLLQNVRDVIKRKLEFAENDVERLRGLKSHINGVLRWLSRITRRQALEKICPLLSPDATKKLLDSEVNAIRTEFGLHKRPCNDPFRELYDFTDGQKPGLDELKIGKSEQLAIKSEAAN